MTDLERYTEACNYPGLIDPPSVERHLADYLKALGVKRQIVQIKHGWEPNDYPSLVKYAHAILADIRKRNPRAARAARAARDALDARAARDARDARAARAARDARDALDALDARAARAARAARDARAALAAQAAQDALDALDARDARAARAARAARDALDARAALDARDARAARDALDAQDGAKKRFIVWCINRGSWYWYGFDLSWLATTYIGAIQTKNPSVQQWSKPVFEAFIAGAWLLHWTEDTLYWISKPVVHREAFVGGKRLHNSEAAAIESDLEDWYFWHGVFVPSHVVTSPNDITLSEIENQENAEVRRVMLTRYEEVRYKGAYINDLGLKPVQEDRFGTLFQKEFSDGTSLLMVRVTNSTPEPNGESKQYWLKVDAQLRPLPEGRRQHPETLKWLETAEEAIRRQRDFLARQQPQELTAHAAVASTFGLRQEQYNPEFES